MVKSLFSTTFPRPVAHLPPAVVNRCMIFACTIMQTGVNFHRNLLRTITVLIDMSDFGLLPQFERVPEINFRLGERSSESFVSQINNAYETMVTWQKKIFPNAIGPLK